MNETQQFSVEQEETDYRQQAVELLDDARAIYGDLLNTISNGGVSNTSLQNIEVARAGNDGYPKIITPEFEKRTFLELEKNKATLEAMKVARISPDEPFRYNELADRLLSERSPVSQSDYNFLRAYLDKVDKVYHTLENWAHQREHQKS